MNGKTFMQFGKYAGYRMEDVPAQYLLWLYDQKRKNGFKDTDKELMDYIEEVHSALMTEADDYIPEFTPSR